MRIAFHIPSPLREFTGGQAQVTLEVPPSTVRDALSVLWDMYPGLRDRIMTEQGLVREHVNVFVNDENIRFTGWLETPVPNGAEIHLIPAISGGAQ